MTAVSPCQLPPYPRRFGWPMRIFLSLFIVAITYRCFGIFFPFDDWRSDLGLHTYPRPLPTQRERADLAGQTSDDHPHPVFEEFMKTADSVWDYWKPWPDADTRPKIKSWTDGGKFTACWINSHLAFVEHVCAIDEGWPMFSPSVVSEHVLTRARLFYDDDSDVVLRQTSEPEDYGHFWRWFNDKRGNYERHAVPDDDEGCQGYCNLLRHRYAQNAAGAKLVKIVLFRIKIVAPPPGTDPVAHYADQNRRTATPPRLPGQYRSDRARPAALVAGAAAGPTAGRAVRRHAELWTPQVLADFYECDAATGKGTMLSEEK